MLKRFAMMTAVAAVVVGGAGLPTAVAGPYDPKTVPADAKWAAHIDVDAVVKSAFWPMIQQRMEANPQTQNGLAQLEQFAGMTFPQDLHSVTLVGTGFEEGNLVLVIDARVNREQMLAWLQMNPAFATTNHNGHEILSWEDKGKVNHGSFFSANQIVVGPSQADVAKVIDVLDGKADAVKASSAMAQIGGTGTLIGAGSDAIAQMAAAQKNKNNPVLKQLQTAWLSVSQPETDVLLKSNFGVGDPQKAEQFRAMAVGAKAFMMMAANQEKADPGMKLLAPLLPGAQATAKGSEVQITWKAPFEQVKQFIETAEAAKKAQAAR